MGRTQACYFCNRPFPLNDVLEYTPHGSMLAYDPVRGRLWIVCGNCRRWSLTPIEERWETLETLEQLRTDRARLLAETENIALLEASGLRLVRVGRAGLREQAWWRYGRELIRRHQRSLDITGRGAVLDTILDVATPVIAFLLVGWPVRRHIEPGVEPWLDRARWRDFGPFAWRGELACAVCGSRRTEVLFKDSDEIMIRPHASGYALRMRCRHCRSLAEPASGHHIVGQDADHVLRRLLAYHNYDGASERQTDVASALIVEAGTPARLIHDIVQRSVWLGQLKSRELLSLEICANEEIERRITQLEVTELQQRWKEEESVAGVADGELTPWPRWPSRD